MELKKISQMASVDATVEGEKYTYNVNYKTSQGRLTEVQIGVHQKAAPSEAPSNSTYRGTVSYNNGAVVQTLVGDTTLDERVLIMQEAEQVYKLVAADISVL